MMAKLYFLTLVIYVFYFILINLYVYILCTLQNVYFIFQYKMLKGKYFPLNGIYWGEKLLTLL